jgi:large subunit ribosomal protein L25
MKLDARKRAAGGAGPLRQEGRLPAVVYNSHLNLSVSVELKAFDRVFRSQGTSSVIDLDVDGELHAVLVKAVQMDKRRRLPQHVDFFAVTANEPVSVHVPIEFVGTAVGTRDGGQLDVQRREVHISVLPRLIPNHVEIDVTALRVGDSLHVRDVQALLPPEASVLDDLDLAVVAIVPPRVVSEDAEASDAAAEPEVIARGGEDDEA